MGPDRTQLLAHGQCGDISSTSHRTPGLEGLEQRWFCPPGSASGRASPPGSLAAFELLGTSQETSESADCFTQNHQKAFSFIFY